MVVWRERESEARDEHYGVEMRHDTADDDVA